MTTFNGRGRPSLGDVANTANLSIKVTAKQKVALEEQAKREHKPVGELGREGAILRLAWNDVRDANGYLSLAMAVLRQPEFLQNYQDSDILLDCVQDVVDNLNPQTIIKSNGKSARQACEMAEKLATILAPYMTDEIKRQGLDNHHEFLEQARNRINF